MSDAADATSRATHWESVYRTKQDAETSWFQKQPATSLNLIREFASIGARIVDVGGGASALAGQLQAEGYEVTVVDISAAAIERAKHRNQPHSDRIDWIVADVTEPLSKAPGFPSLGPNAKSVHSPHASFDLWHDRAVFHFLTGNEDRHRYIDRVVDFVKPGGIIIIAAFALDGPEKCSGLPVERYDAGKIGAVFGQGFSVLKSLNENHITPWGKPQAFCYTVLQRSA